MAKKITDQDGNVYIQKKPVYKRLWFIILAAIVLIVIIQQTSGEKKKDGSDSKDLNFNKVYMRTHRRSGLLISKFAF